ncbi:Gfo/Idh/MocA family oxidoreductase [Amycolatopsis mongoliensis]|uniref:Gfo/Idh/MocA family oxidoreductase n=1 Tax=Amycolatopsis mongoliensis TaxID=715475 RepID=A0A9Y2NKB2_9PSEU|nr:Gfo/Idh/MocA family oxidoreductase [Amycolatopsis sp. 4-36]WIY00960.1 Gfo/Idh/MocA family oxidoreductase [Amycolatopsis sp. 4-36]
MTTPLPATVLVGTGGYGLRHLRSLLGLHRDGLIDLTGLVDVAVSTEARQAVAEHGLAPAWYPSLEDALAAGPVDSVVISTPPHTHFTLARTAIEAKAAVYLEKPPVTLLQDLDALAALPASRRVEVGFQDARATVAALSRAWAALGRPAVDDVVAYGALARPDEYYRRSRWAGHWFLDGRAVLDGPLFNPLAHVVQAALLFAARVEDGWSPAQVVAECFHVRALPGDDTSAIRVVPHRGPRVLAVGTTASDVVVHPGVLVHTGDGVIRVSDGGRRVTAWRRGTRIAVTPATPATSALRAAVTDPDGAGDPLLSPAATRAFVLTGNAAVQAMGSPHPAPVAASPGPDGVRAAGLGRLVAACARRGALLSEVAPAWGGATRRLDVAGYRGLVHPDLSPTVVTTTPSGPGAA